MYKRVFKDHGQQVFWGDCLEVMRDAKENSIDAVITDPPYELGFMNKHWDSKGIAFCKETWELCYRVLKPGGYLVTFGGTRTFHRVAVVVEDVGFEIRDSIAWIYSSGFPKSQNIALAIDKQAGVVGNRGGRINHAGQDGYNKTSAVLSKAGNLKPGYTNPILDEAKEWEGWGTALKPAFEPIILARKPISEKTVAANVLTWGTGAINIDECRIDYVSQYDEKHQHDIARGQDNAVNGKFFGGHGVSKASSHTPIGRWPANVVLDNIVANEFDSISHFFYCSKANRKERPESSNGIVHPTVKPLDLMCWLVRMVVSPNGRVLDPFAGSGTTLEAAMIEGVKCIAIEQEKEYIGLIKTRVDRQLGNPTPKRKSRQERAIKETPQERVARIKAEIEQIDKQIESTSQADVMIERNLL